MSVYYEVAGQKESELNFTIPKQPLQNPDADYV